MALTTTRSRNGVALAVVCEALRSDRLYSDEELRSLLLAATGEQYDTLRLRNLKSLARTKCADDKKETAPKLSPAEFVKAWEQRQSESASDTQTETQ